MIPAYRERLRAEGLMLAASGAMALVLVVALAEEATRRPWSSAVQLAIVAALMATLGARSVRRSMAAAQPLDPDRPGSGEPTPLWQHPLIVAGLALGRRAGSSLFTGTRLGTLP